MPRVRCKKTLPVILMFIAIISILLLYNEYSKSYTIWQRFPSNEATKIAIHKQRRQEIIITVVTCETRLEETLTMIKSALLFNKLPTVISFKIIAEDVLKLLITKQLRDWQKILADTFSFQVYSLKFPKINENIWRTLFKPCAAQRLFLPSLLGNIDATIYVDTDIVFLSSASDIWNHFSKFNASHIAGLSPEHEDVNIGWYNRFARHPFFGELGVNSGVMLMNLTKMREFKWEEKILPIYKKYKSQITWGDQDLINILFAMYPEKLYIFPCTYNYRPDHCMYMNVCNITEKVRILHGNRSYFHSDKQPLFKQIYETFKNADLKVNESGSAPISFSHVFTNEAVNNSTCGKILGEIGLRHSEIK